MRTRFELLLTVLLLLIAPSGPAWAIVAGQVDDFEDGTTQAWREGVLSPNPPTNQPSGGPAGVGDNYLENVSGGGLAGSRQIMFNQLQWSGDYVAAGVVRIDMDLANFGATELAIRIALQGALFDRFSSTQAFALPPDGQWRSASFDLTEGALTQVLGVGTLEAALSGVTTLRILSAAGGPSFMGDPIFATLGVDNISAGCSVATGELGSADLDGDGTCDADDICPTVTNAGADGDGDGIDDACDTCPNDANQLFTGDLTNRTLVSGQLDDDADGVGNACDFDYDQIGAFLSPADLAQAVASQGGFKPYGSSTCGTGNDLLCGLFDHDGQGLFVSPADFAADVAKQGFQLNGPSCGAACTPPLGGAIASGTEVLGKAICVGPSC